MISLPASDPGSAAVWGSKRINPRPQSCLCLAWSGCPSNDDDDDDEPPLLHFVLYFLDTDKTVLCFEFLKKLTLSFFVDVDWVLSFSVRHNFMSSSTLTLQKLQSALPYKHYIKSIFRQHLSRSRHLTTKQNLQCFSYIS